MFVRDFCVLLGVTLCAVGCGELEDPSDGSLYYDEVKTVDTTVESLALVDGTPEAVGVLAFVNDEATSYRMLDIDAKLDRRAARASSAKRASLLSNHCAGTDACVGYEHATA